MSKLFALLLYMALIATFQPGPAGSKLLHLLRLLTDEMILLFLLFQDYAAEACV